MIDLQISDNGHAFLKFTDASDKLSLGQKVFVTIEEKATKSGIVKAKLSKNEDRIAHN